MAFNGASVGLRVAGGDDPHVGASAVFLRCTKLLSASAERCSIMSECLPVSPLTITVT